MTSIKRSFNVSDEDEREFDEFLKSHMKPSVIPGIHEASNEQMMLIVEHYKNKPNMLAYAMFRSGWSASLVLTIQEANQGLTIAEDSGLVPPGFKEEYISLLWRNMLENTDTVFNGPKIKAMSLDEHKDCDTCKIKDKCPLRPIVEMIKSLNKSANIEVIDLSKLDKNREDDEPPAGGT